MIDIIMRFIILFIIFARLWSTGNSQEGKCPKKYGTITGSTLITIQAHFPVHCVLNIVAGSLPQGRIKLRFMSSSTNAMQSRVVIKDNNSFTTFDTNGILGNSYNSMSNNVVLNISSDNSTTSFTLGFRVIVMVGKKTPSPATTQSPTTTTTTVSTTPINTSTEEKTILTTTLETSTRAGSSIRNLSSGMQMVTKVNSLQFTTTPTIVPTTTSTTTPTATSTNTPTTTPTTTSTTTPTTTSTTTTTTTKTTTTTTSTTIETSDTLLTSEISTSSPIATKETTTAMSLTTTMIANKTTTANKNSCAAASFPSRGIKVDFPATPLYHLALSTNVCGENGRPEGTAVCSTIRSTPAQSRIAFQSVYTVPCNVTFSHLKNPINRKTLSDLVVLTSLPGLLTFKNITDVIEILQIASSQVEINQEVLVDVTNTITNLANSSVTHENETLRTSSSLKRKLLTTLRSFVSHSSGEINIISPNIEIQSSLKNFSEANNLQFQPMMNKNDSGSYVKINSSSADDFTSLNSSIFTFFAQGVLMTDSIDCTSQVIGVGKTNSNNSNLNYDVSFGHYQALYCVHMIEHQKLDHSSARCSFGQLKKLDHDHWSRNEDCKRRADGKYSCHSPGTFAIFFTSVRIPQALALSIFTYVGCGISVIFLLITIIIHLSISEVRSKTTTKFLFNICICLLALYIFFILGITITSHGPICDFMAFAIQFFALATFAWMSANSYKMLRIFGQFNYNMKSHNKLMYVATYGLPLSISLISYIISLKYFDRVYEDPNAIILSEECKTNESNLVPHACWLYGDSQIYGFLVPIAIALSFNSIIFFILVKIVVLRKKTIRSSRKERKAKDKIINAITMATMMGLTWILGFFLLITEDETYNSVLQWLFTVVNTLLGVMIFYLTCLRRRDIQKLWLPRRIREMGLIRKTNYLVQSSPSSQYNASFRRRSGKPTSDLNSNRSIYRSKREFPNQTSTTL